MSKYKALLLELFQQDSHLPYKKEFHINPFHHHYSFNSGSGQKYDVHIHHHKYVRGEAEVRFSSGDKEKSTGITGKEKNAASSVLSTVHHITKTHLASHPKISHVSFSADASQPTRVKLYRHMIGKMTNNQHEEENGHDKEGSYVEWRAHRDSFK